MRNSRGLTQAELGELVGVSKMSIYNIERGTHTPLETIVQIATVLGYDVYVSFVEKDQQV